ncbi:hypothetical protein N7462_003884 [Penicillium macrosclerotiorum]|uniref:uncharacterized protein n=1 Tax=Penicillium macrosclerotiorum TaxID=303699 RepID=UPI002546D6CB|nr:uncharacterized protein N7462_003884 [Penicillium macrosclerotiorum]KAJ5689492.1 hypothetical protein N7462_003884 [Penicillium macrosclerotiorum]
MAPSASKWWQAPDDADLDYGFESDDLDTRFAEPVRNYSHRRPLTRQESEREAREQEADGEGGVLRNMSAWFQRQAGSHNSQLATTAVLSGAAAAAAVFGYQAYKRKEAVNDLKASIPAVGEEHREGKGLAKLRSSFIIVVGCGGVGSHAAASLARSGVAKIRLIDFDQVTLSSLNRHALATLADVGTPKVHCIRRRLEQIAPWVMFDCRNELFGKSAADDLLGPWTLTHDGEGRRPDFVLDCIDNITSKVDLLHYCHTNSLPVISSMGAGCKSDPTRVVVGDISNTIDDPLARSTRRRLKALGVSSGIAAVFSTEKPGPGKASLLPLPDEEFAKGQVGELGVLPDFRVRILPVLGTMPAVFGYTVANHVICSVSGYPIDYCVSAKGREKLYDSALAFLQGFMERQVRQVAGEDPVGLRLPITKDDLAFLVEEVWRGRSAITGLSNRLVLIPWETPAQGFGMDRTWEGEKDGQKVIRLELTDLVCMTKDEATLHEREVIRGSRRPEDVYDEAALQRVTLRKKEIEAYQQYR